MHGCDGSFLVATIATMHLLQSQIFCQIVTYRGKYIQQFCLGQRYNTVYNIARNSNNLPGFQHFAFLAQRKLHLAPQHNSHLLMWMAMTGPHSSRLKDMMRDHQMLTSKALSMNAWCSLYGFLAEQITRFHKISFIAVYIFAFKYI